MSNRATSACYCQLVRQEEWSVRLVRVIAQEVRRHRDAQKISAQQLADRCTDLGLPIKRSVIANLETGHRETVTVPELLVLGAALNVSPALLAIPVGRSESVEILPELDVRDRPGQPRSRVASGPGSTRDRR